jgi:RND family efflux transporter MFP subunit
MIRSMRRNRGFVKMAAGLVVATVLAVVSYALLAYARPVVVVSEAVRAPVVQAFYSTGTVQPTREYPIRSSAAGILVAVHVDKGTPVKRGQILAEVKDPGLNFALDRARAELEEKLARADEKDSPVLGELDARIASISQMLDLASRDMERRESLAGVAGGLSESELDRARDRVKMLWGDLEAAKAQRAARALELKRDVEVARAAVRTAEWNVEQLRLVSPIDGVVLDRPISPGTRVAVNDPIMRIADVSPENLVMRAAVDEEDVARVRVEQSVRMTLYAFPDRVFLGTVAQVYDQADPDRRTFEVDVRLEDPDVRLAPGMTGELVFVLGERTDSLVVPSQAVVNGAVWVVREGRVRRTEVRTGLSSVERTEIVDGLEPGTLVVVSPTNDLTDGQRVRWRTAPPPASPAPPAAQARSPFRS